MKIRTIIFATVAAALTLVLTACGDNPEGQTFKVYYEDVEVTNDQNITINTYVMIGEYIEFKGYVSNESDNDITILVRETRNYDLNSYTSQFCFNDCVPCNGEKVQEYSCKIKPGDEQTFFAHFEVSEDKRNESTSQTAVYEFIEGENTIKVNVTFEYNAPEL